MNHRKNYSKKNITVSVKLVNREDITKKFYLRKPSNYSDWKNIFLFKFSNNFNYYYGTNKSYVDGHHLMTFLFIESELVYNSKSPLDFKNKLKSRYNSNISIKNANKIFNWFKNNNEKILNIINQFIS